MHKPFLLSLFLSLSIHYHALADDWFSQDKALHFLGSAGISASVYALNPELPRDQRLLVAAIMTLGLGAFKEVMDMEGSGDPSLKDMTWNALGTLSGLLVAYVIDLFSIPAIEPNHDQTTPPSSMPRLRPE